MYFGGRKSTCTDYIIDVWVESAQDFKVEGNWESLGDCQR